MSLEKSIEGAAYEIAFWMIGIFDDDYPLEQLGDRSMDVSDQLRTVAVSLLLSGGSTNGFCHNLIRSARVRERYLQRCSAAGLLDDHFRASGWYQPFADAVAAGDFALGRRIVDLSPEGMIAGHEYEEDYCYAQILHGLVAGTEEHTSALLTQFERCLEGSLSGRYQVAKALTERDQGKFEGAFDQILADRQREIAADMERCEIESPPVLAARRVFVEGLAVLRLAERFGLRTAEEYLFCPSVARVPMTTPFPGE